MPILSRHVLAVAVRRVAWVFLLLQVFLVLWGLFAALSRHPYLSAPALAEAALDVVLAAVSVTLPLAVLAGGIVAIASLRQGGRLLRVALAGRDPRRPLSSLVAVGAVAAASLAWLNAEVLPQVSHRMRYIHKSFGEEISSLALLLAREPGLIDGFRTNFASLEQGELRDLTLTSRNPHETTVLTARRAALDVVKGGAYLRLSLAGGRLVALDGDALALNLRFDAMTLRLSTGRLAKASKRKILDLKYYATSELGRLREQARLRARHGLRHTKKTERRLHAIPLVRAARLQSSLAPLLFSILLVYFLGAYDVRNFRRRAVLVGGLCLGLLLPQQVFLAARARSGDLTSSWMALLPAFETALVLAAAVIWKAIRRGRAP